MKKTVSGIFAAGIFAAMVLVFLAVQPFPATAAESSGSPGTGDAAESPGSLGGGVSPLLQSLMRDAVFEVVLKKPDEKNITYNKELDWSVVPYAIRTDKYYSIGTAFAVSALEVVTASHVIDLSCEGEVFKEYYIRDSRGNVYEVDTVVRMSNERDFLVFTVKNRTFSSWFEMNPEFALGSQVFSIGNALGEGVVIRNGLVLGTVPEEEDGRWNLLKSSADGNPGNSGGPLVTPDGRVVAVVIALRDNILYSLPVKELLDTPRGTTHFRRKSSYGHLLLSDNRTDVFEIDVKLPAPYKELRSALYNAYKAYYPGAMEALFQEAPAYLEGPNNRFILNQINTSDFPEFTFMDKNDDQWKLSDLRTQSFNLPDDGAMIQAAVSEFKLIKLRRPKTVSLEKINTDPKTVMDLILSGAAMERTLRGSNKYRILSFGEPEGKAEYRDRQGRTWIEAWWLIDYEDSIMLAYILPMPNGPVVFMTRQDSHERHVYEWDMQATCDRIAAAYRGDLNEWNEYLAMNHWVPKTLEGMKYRWDEAKKTVNLSLPQLTLDAGAAAFDWNSQSTLFMAPAYYLNEGTVEYGIRSTILQRDIKGNDYCILYKNVKPDERLGAKVMENWTNVVEAKYPFDGISRVSTKDNTGAVGVVLPADDLSPDVRYTLYLTMESPGAEDALAERFNSLKAGITIKE